MKLKCVLYSAGVQGGGLFIINFLCCCLITTNVQTMLCSNG